MQGEAEHKSCASPKLNGIKGVKAKRWGWYVESTFPVNQQGEAFTFDMYAGAGKNVLANGAFAGTVVVTVTHDGYSDYEVHPADGFCFDDIHLHVSNELPTQKKKRGHDSRKKKRGTTTTVAPGRYSQTKLTTGPYLLHHRARGRDMHALRTLNVHNSIAGVTGCVVFYRSCPRNGPGRAWK